MYWHAKKDWVVQFNPFKMRFNAQWFSTCAVVQHQPFVSWKTFKMGSFYEWIHEDPIAANKKTPLTSVGWSLTCNVCRSTWSTVVILTSHEKNVIAALLKINSSIGKIFTIKLTVNSVGIRKRLCRKPSNHYIKYLMIFFANNSYQSGNPLQVPWYQSMYLLKVFCRSFITLSSGCTPYRSLARGRLECLCVEIF